MLACSTVYIGADSTGATGKFAPVLTQELGQTLRFAPVPFMAVLWFFKWTLQLYLLNLTKGAKFAGFVGHPMIKMLSASGGLRSPDLLTTGSAPGPPFRLVLRTRYGAPSTTDPFRRLWVQLNFAPVPQNESRRLSFSPLISPTPFIPSSSLLSLSFPLPLLSPSL